MTSSDFDFQSFYLIDLVKSICTFANNNSWFQIQFSYGTVILTGFCLKRCNIIKIKSYKIICTDDVFKSEENWITLIEIKEKTKLDHKILDIYDFPNLSPPIKFVRLIQTEPAWDNKLNLNFFSF